MKPLGQRFYKTNLAKHQVSGADRKLGFVPWWSVEIKPNKKRARRIDKLNCRDYLEDEN